MNGAFVGGVTANRAIAYETTSVSQVRVAMAGMLDGAAEKLTIQGAQVALDGTAATGSVTLDTDVWNWTATGNVFTFTMASGNATAAQTDKLVQSLGYLNTQATPTQGNRTMDFVITDAQGLQSAAAVHTIAVDNTAPVFADASAATLTLGEVSAFSGASLLSVSATDASTAAGGKITYRLTGADSARFAVDASGNITLRQALDFEVATDANTDNVYQFTVNAVDDAGNFGSKDVFLTVENVAEALDLNGVMRGSGLVHTYNRDSASTLNLNGATTSIATLPSVTIGGSMTISADVWLDSKAGWGGLFEMMRGSTFRFGLFQNDLAGTADQFQLTQGAWVGNAESGMFRMLSDFTPLNGWNHVTCTFDATNGTATTYVNGRAIMSSFGLSPIADANTTLAFGGLSWNPTARWNGSMRDLRVYDDARTEGEIRGDMLGIIDLSDPDLKAAYLLNSASTASALAGQAALTLGEGASVGALRLLDNATIASTATVAKVRITAGDIRDGANERLTIGSTQIALDGTSGTGTVTVGADSWTWTRSGADVVFSLVDSTPAKAQALLNALNYTHTAATVTDGDRNFTVSLLNSSDVVQDSQVMTIKVDMSGPVFGAAADITTVSFAENTSASTVLFNANATDGSGSVTYTLSGLDADRFNVSSTGAVTFKDRPDFENARDVNGDNVYNFNVTATDANGNSSHKSVTLTVTDVASDSEGYQSPKGQSVIDLGSFGKLILPVEVEGKTYYYWDRSGDGTISNGGQLNAGVDTVDVPSQAAVNGLFKFASDFTTQNSGSNPTDTFRFATLNGVRVALPTFDGEDTSNGSIGYDLTTQQTRHADGSVNNPVHDDMLAIWDAFNGVRTGSVLDSASRALGWALDNYYLTATTADNGANLMVHMNPGYVGSTGVNATAYSIALQVL